MAKYWKDVPLYVYTDPKTKDRFILPTDRDFFNLDESKNKVLEQIDLAKAKSDNSRVKVLTDTIESLELTTEKLKEKFNELKDKSELRNYKVAEPEFDEFVTAEEKAKDWINGEPKINEGILAKQIFAAGNLKLDDEVLTEDQVKKMRYPEINKLWVEVQAMIYPDVNRLAFLN
jgi:hypothetical protein